MLESAVTTRWLKRSELAYKNARLLSRPELNLHLEAIAGSELVLIDTWGHIIWLGEAAEPASVEGRKPRAARLGHPPGARRRPVVGNTVFGVAGAGVTIRSGGSAPPHASDHRSHLLGRSLRGPPGGLALVSAVSGDETANSPRWQLLVVRPVTVLVVAAFISIPAHVGARRPAAETSEPNSPDARQADMRRTIDLTAIGEDLR